MLSAINLLPKRQFPHLPLWQERHLNGIGTDNRNKNLLICTNAFHRWLHNYMGRQYQKEHFN